MRDEIVREDRVRSKPSRDCLRQSKKRLKNVTEGYDKNNKTLGTDSRLRSTGRFKQDGKRLHARIFSILRPLVFLLFRSRGIGRGVHSGSTRTTIHSAPVLSWLFVRSVCRPCISPLIPFPADALMQSGGCPAPGLFFLLFRNFYREEKRPWHRSRISGSLGSSLRRTFRTSS